MFQCEHPKNCFEVSFLSSGMEKKLEVCLFCPYVILMKNFLNPKESNRLIGPKVTATSLKGWILPIGGVDSGRVSPTACAAGLCFFILEF